MEITSSSEGMFVGGEDIEKNAFTLGRAFFECPISFLKSQI
jgi:hypothetical protein